MAHGVELVLGFTYDKWPILEKGIGLSIPRPIPGDKWGFAEYEAGYFDEMSEDDALADYWDQCDMEGNINTLMKPFQPKLYEAWERACGGMGWTKKKTVTKYDISQVIWETPLGDREMSPWYMEFYCDPVELGDRPTTALFGVSISGRYFPTFLDWRSHHGCLWNQVVGPGVVKEMEVARTALIMAYEVFGQADWIIREKHY